MCWLLSHQKLIFCWNNTRVISILIITAYHFTSFFSFRDVCYCFDSLETKVDESECTKSCTGDSASKCGAANDYQTKSVYQTKPQAITDGSWSEWGNWFSNGEFCIKNRTRTCTNPIPSAGGANCTSDGSSRVIFPGPLPDNFYPPENSSTSYLNDSMKTSDPSGLYNVTGHPNSPNGELYGPAGQDSFPNNTGQIQFRQLSKIKPILVFDNSYLRSRIYSRTFHIYH